LAFIALGVIAAQFLSLTKRDLNLALSIFLLFLILELALSAHGSFWLSQFLMSLPGQWCCSEISSQQLEWQSISSCEIPGQRSPPDGVRTRRRASQDAKPQAATMIAHEKGNSYG
jgi:hypothetical protein